MIPPPPTLECSPICGQWHDYLRWCKRYAVAAEWVAYAEAGYREAVARALAPASSLQ